MRFAGRLLDPEAEYPGGADPYDRCVVRACRAAGRVYGFRVPADFQEPHTPRLGRRDVVDDKRGSAIAADVPEFLAGGHPEAADVDRSQVRVITESDRLDL